MKVLHQLEYLKAGELMCEGTDGEVLTKGDEVLEVN